MAGQSAPTPRKPFTYIQWKGTDVCLDIHCACGTSSHFDGYFCYYFRCSKCGVVYKLGDSVTLTPVDEDDAYPIQTDEEPWGDSAASTAAEVNAHA